MSITKERKAELISAFGKDANDSGSAAVQVAILTDRIVYLTETQKPKKRFCFTSWPENVRPASPFAGLYPFWR